MRCSICLSDADGEYKKSWGCDEPKDTPVWELDSDVYFSCPISFIPQEVYEWYTEYEYFTSIRGESYQDLPWTWIYCYTQYRAAMQEFEQRRQAERNAKNDSLKSFNRTGKGDLDG